MATETEMTSLADALVAPTLAAARAIMKYYRQDVAVMTKGDDSPVTKADQEAEEILLEALNRLMPGVPVVAEELASRGEAPAHGGDLFLVDPVDGTRGFIKGRPEFTVNVGLVSGGQPQFGLIYAPALSEFYVTTGPGTALSADVAFSAEAGGIADLSARPMKTRPLDKCRLTAVSSRYVSKRLTRHLEGLSAERVDANSSIKFCILARGDADLYPRYGEISEWDTAAGAAIVASAGGCTTNFDGTPSVYGKTADGYRNAPFISWSTPTPDAELLAALNAD